MRRALKQHAPSLKDDDILRQHFGFGGDVGGKDGQMIRHGLFEQAVDAPAFVKGEAIERFVQQEERRVAQKRLGNADQPKLAAGKRS